MIRGRPACTPARPTRAGGARPLLVLASAVLAVTSAGSAAQAAPPKTLFVARGVPSEDLPPLERALTGEAGLSLVDSADARARLERLAATLEADPGPERVAHLLRRARAAYVELRLDTAGAAYGKALDALLAEDRQRTQSHDVARVLFERSLVWTAARRDDRAEADLALAVTLNPDLSPDRDVYGPPVFRALGEARRRRSKRPIVRLRVDRAPEDAVVYVDGVLVPPGEDAAVRGFGRHLLTAERPGYAPVSRFVELTSDGARRVELVLRRAPPALLAAQALAVWPTGEDAGGGAPPSDAAPLAAAAVGATRIVEVVRRGPGRYSLRLLHAPQGDLIRSSEGGRVPWEVEPFTVLAAALDGRVLRPPSPSEVALAVTVPSEVEPSEAIPVRVSLQDPGRRVRRLQARCGRERAAAAVDDAAPTLLLSPAAPGDERTIACEVLALDAESRVLARGGDREAARVAVRKRDRWYAKWYGWGSLALLGVGGAVLAGVLATRDGDGQHVLRIEAPR